MRGAERPEVLVMIKINKALFIFHDELISGQDSALSNVMKEKVA